MYCTNCGFGQHNEGAKFCTCCGTALFPVNSEQKDNVLAEIPQKIDDAVKEATIYKDEMKKDLIAWGIVMIVMGVISFIPNRFIDPSWGVIIIIAGVITLLVRRRGMYIMIGVLLLFIGLLNFFAGKWGGWTFFGVLQIYFGIQEIRKYWKYNHAVIAPEN